MKSFKTSLTSTSPSRLKTSHSGLRATASIQLDGKKGGRPRLGSEPDQVPPLKESPSPVQRRVSRDKVRPQSYLPGRHINPTGYELDSELVIADQNIGMSQEEYDEYNKILSSKEIEELGMSTMEIEAKKRGQRWRNLSYILFKNHHSLTFPELRKWVLFERKLNDSVPPFDEHSIKDRLWQKVDIEKSVAEFTFGFGLAALHNSKATAMTHPNGVQLSGFAKMTLKVPPQSERDTGAFILSKQNFFKEGDKKPIMVRFSNFGSSSDDREACVRGGSIKFSEHPEQSEFDIIMATGGGSPFYNYDSLHDASAAGAAKANGNLYEEGGYKEWLYKQPTYLREIIEGYVRAPSSFARLLYFSQFPVLLKDTLLSSSQYYCKFRMVPDVEGPLEGLLSSKDQHDPCDVAAKAHDNREPDYLRKEIVGRLKTQSRRNPKPHFRLQVRFKKREFRRGDKIFAMYWSDVTWENEPWIDFASVTLTGAMDNTSQKQLRMNVANLPPCLSIEKPTWSSHPSWIMHARSQIYPAMSGLRQIFSMESQKDEKQSEYKVSVKTGEYMWAGTNSLVQIKIIGDMGVTKLQSLDNWGDDNERGDKCRYSFDDINVGNIQYVSLFLDKTIGIQDYWYVDYVKVAKLDKDGKSGKVFVKFPIFSWITEDHDTIISISTNKTVIPQKDTVLRRIARTQQTKKDLLHWQHSLQGFFGFTGTKPSFTYDCLNWNFKYHDEQDRNFYRRFDASIRNGNLQQFLSLFKSFDSLDDFSKASGCLGKRNYEWMRKDIWKSDVEFGRQILNGANPYTIKRCDYLPTTFPLTTSMVKSILCRGMTLEQEMAAGNVFIIDYKILQGISTGQYKDQKINLPSPICLLYIRTNVKKEEQLVPIAIQLGQTPGKECPIWTPNDKPLDWLLAKMWFKNADLHIQYLMMNSAGIHMFLEPFAIAMHRCLPPVHPVFKLLSEHLRYAIGTNTISRETLLCKEGSYDRMLSVGLGSTGIHELLQRSLRSLRYDDYDLPLDIGKRRLEKVPNYHFRDDASEIWYAIMVYVKNVIAFFYSSDDDVLDDVELQHWVKEIYSLGFAEFDPEGAATTRLKLLNSIRKSNRETVDKPKNMMKQLSVSMKRQKSASVRLGSTSSTEILEEENFPDKEHINLNPVLSFKFPSHLSNVDELVQMITRVIFTGSVVHRAISGPSFEYTHFAPNNPACMRGSMPTELDRGKIDMTRILDSLPDQRLSAIQAGIAYTLSNMSGRPLYLTEISPRWMFNEPQIKEFYQQFVAHLMIIEKGINERNSTLKIPYTVLLPSKIPYGIGI